MSHSETAHQRNMGRNTIKLAIASHHKRSYFRLRDVASPSLYSILIERLVWFLLLHYLRRSHCTLKSSPVLRIYIIAFLGLFLGAVGSGVMAQPVGIAFESFMVRPPVIDKLIYVRTVLPQPTAPYLTTFAIVLDGPNALLAEVDLHGNLLTNGMTRGYFDGVFWNFHANSSVLELADPAINNEVPIPDLKEETGIRSAEATGACGERAHLMFKDALNEVLRLGFWEIDPDAEILWDKEQSCFWATASPRRAASASERHRKRKVIINLNYKNGRPTSAILRDASGDKIGPIGVLVAYKYTNTFCDGAFPVELTHHLPSPTAGDGHETPDLVIRFKELQLASGPLQEGLINPRERFKSKYLTTLVWSNNVNYRITKMGKMAKVLTAEEATIINQRAKERRAPGKATGVRIMLVLVMLVPITFFIVRRLVTEHKRIAL